MPSASLLPLEIEEKIIDFLAEDDNNYFNSALKSCSLVCHAFLPICRKHIFAFISLCADLGRFTPHALGKLLSERPEIANYIRTLNFDLKNQSIPESLMRISRLESLTIWTYCGEASWSNHAIRPILLHLLHLPTLTHLTIYFIKDFVIWDLMPCVNLKHLSLLDVACAPETTFPATFPKDPIQLNEFVADAGSATAIMKLCTARRPDGQSLIDFRSLSKITVVLETLKDGEASQELLKCCETLADVHITFSDPRKVRPSLANMLRPLMQTLKHIVVNVHIDDVNDAPLFDIPSELEDMRTTKNIIERVTIELVVGRYGDCSRGEDWGRLDEVLTSSGWVALKRVSLTVEIDVLKRDGDEKEREAALRDLLETQFPRLSTSDDVSFHWDTSLS